MFKFSRNWAWPDELNRAGILGINRRNLTYIMEANDRSLFPKVDNKLITKEICQQRGIPVPDTYGVLRVHSDLPQFTDIISGRNDFVVKPAAGAAGRGITVVVNREKGNYITPGGNKITHSDMRYHLSTIISGLYSLGGQIDSVIIEQRLVSHPVLKKLTEGGTPDVRVILYRGVPAMAMVRLPTHRSGGKANLHQGAVAAAIDLRRGTTFGGVCENRAVANHPDTGEPVVGLDIPDWDRLLLSAMELGDALELGYIGVDFVLDAVRGPVVLEANARPGLAIQVAHRFGILKRLDAIDARATEPLSVESRLDLVANIAAIE